MLATTIAQNFQKVLGCISKAARLAGRSPDAVNLVVVTKTHPVEIIKALIDAGARDFGENYAEEAETKIQTLLMQADLVWHMIGHVQSRKAVLVANHFHYLHSLDSLKLARRLSGITANNGKILPVLLQCNVSGEATKYGWPAWRDELWPQLIPVFQEILDLPGMEVQGLMTMAPYSEKPDDSRPYYSRLRHLRDFLRRSIPQANWRDLSMGMSTDYEVAIQEGATWLRIGQAILGARS